MNPLTEKYSGQILLVTGPRGAGKTTLCHRVVDVARQAGWQIAGVLSPAIVKGGLKIGIGVESLRSGKRYLLAKLPADGDDARAVQTEGWVFDERCLSWGNSVLEKAVPCDLLVVDELGPLELERGQGWTAGIGAVESKKFHLGLVVVREELLNTLLMRWPRANVVTVKNTREIDSLVDRIIEKLFDIQGLMSSDL